MSEVGPRTYCVGGIRGYTKGVKGIVNKTFFRFSLGFLMIVFTAFVVVVGTSLWSGQADQIDPQSQGAHN